MYFGLYPKKYSCKRCVWARNENLTKAAGAQTPIHHFWSFAIALRLNSWSYSGWLARALLTLEQGLKHFGAMVFSFFQCMVKNCQRILALTCKIKVCMFYKWWQNVNLFLFYIYLSVLFSVCFCLSLSVFSVCFCLLPSVSLSSLPPSTYLSQLVRER